MALAAPAGWAQPAARQGQPVPPPETPGLPSLGDAGAMTTLQERKLGDSIIRELYRDPDYLDDPILGEYVDGIWRRLLAAARARGEMTPEMQDRYAWEILLGRDATVNAFSLPGGYFGLQTGLVGAVSSRDELASVLAHEMSHVMQRHIARMLGQQSRQTPLMLATIVLGAIAASRNPEMGAALATGGQAAILQQQLKFSRDMEREADRIGYGVMTQAGFAPEGFVSMFGKLEAASRLNDNGDWPYLRSHPLTTERMADMQQRQQNLPRGTPPPPDLEALMMAARARVESRPGVDMLRTWAKQPEQPGFAQQPLATRAGALYAAAIAGAELRDLPRAQALAAQLAQAVAGDARAARQARLLQAELALQAGQNESALQWLAPLRPDSDAAPQSQSGRAALLMRAQAQIHGGQAAEAASALQPWLSDHPRDAGAWQALAQAWAAQGQTLRQLRAEGEAQMAHMNYAGAVDRWRAAQDFTRQQPSGSVDLIEASIVDARLREGRELLKQQQKDEKNMR